MNCHGSVNHYNAGCRCQECTEANRAYHHNRSWERYADRVLIGDRLIAPAGEHGNANTYKNRGCRCRECTEAHRRRHAAYREQRGEA